MTKKPVLTKTPVQNKPVLKFTPTEDGYTFSFKYFQQIRYFGLSETETAWCVSLLERLRDFNNIEFKHFFNDRSLNPNSA